MSISERCLRLLFTASSQSLARFLWQQRLEFAAERLRDQRYRDPSITEVAFVRGFSDSAPASAGRFAQLSEPPGVPDGRACGPAPTATDEIP